MQYDAKGFTKTISTRLDAFGRVFGPVLDGVDGGELVVEKRSNGEEEMWSVAEVGKKRVEFAHEELFGQGDIRFECRLSE